MTVVRFYPSGTGTNGWTNPTNAYADDTSNATCIPAKNSQVDGIWTNFGITGSGTINSVVIGVKASESVDGTVCSVRGDVTWNAGTSWSTETEIVSTTNLTTTSIDTERTIDVTSATTWTWTNLGNSYFQIEIIGKKGNSSTSYTINMDVVWVDVDYTPPTYTYSLTPLSDTRFFATNSYTRNSDAEFAAVITTRSFTINSDAKFKYEQIYTRTSDAQFKDSYIYTRNSDARFRTTFASTINSDSRFRISNSFTSLSDAIFFKVQELTTTSDANFTIEYSGGDGTSGNPWQITTLNQLQFVKDNLANYFIVMNDIDASSTSGWNGGAGFIPIGATGTPFTGGFDGNGKMISDLYISRSGTNGVGLFGVVTGTITKVEIDGDITGYDNVGVLVGLADTGSIITYSKSLGTVSGHNNIGGLIGRSNGTVYDCYSVVSTIAGTDSVAGLIGYIGSADIDRCYSIGNPSGTTNVGGLIGYATGSTVTDCYWDMTTSGESSSAGGTGKITADMKLLDTFSPEWDISYM